jgi:MFS family permease
MKSNRHNLRRYTPDWLRSGPLRLLRPGLLDGVSLHFFSVSAALQAVLSGAMTVSSVVLKKSLHAGDLQMGWFMALGGISLLIGIFASEFIVGRDKRPFIWRVGLIGRCLCLGFTLAVSPWAFILLSGAFSMLNNALIPATTALWQANISRVNRNALWGMTLTINTLISMIAAWLTGVLLDRDPFAYRWIFPLAGVLALAGIWVLARAPLRGAYRYMHATPPPRTPHSVFVKPVLGFLELLRGDRDFARFENFFFMYGVAFMILAPVVPSFMVDVAGMRFEQTQFAGGVLFQLGGLLLPSLWGRLMDRTGPYKLCGIIFSILALYPLLLLAAPASHGIGIPLVMVVYLAHAVFGAGMAGLNVAWNLAPISFAGKADSGMYTGAHVTLTGIRAMLAPFLGALVLKHFGYSWVFGLAAAIFTVASSWMWWLYRQKLSAARAAPAAA